jgi:hypothetical protein
MNDREKLKDKIHDIIRSETILPHITAHRIADKILKEIDNDN